MEHRFHPDQVKRIRINAPYDIGAAAVGEMQIVIVTPDDGWSVTRRPLSKTVRIVRTRATSSGSVRQVAVARGGNVYQAGRDMTIGGGRASATTGVARIKILIPTGVTRPEVTSL